MNAWVVVPIFNEAATVGRVVRAARRHAPVLVVDDGSTDDGGAAARAAGADVLRHPQRLGKGQALRSGIAAVRQRGATHAVTLDGDGQHSADDIPVLLAAACEAPGAIVIGSRLGRGEESDALPRNRLNAIRVAGFFVSWVSGLHVEDTQSGFRVYPVAVFDGLRARRGGFVLETEVLIAAAARGVCIVERPITVAPRVGQRSRFRPVGDGVAIGAYLAGRVVVRWAAEARAASAELLAVTSHDTPQAHHRISSWWHHPRRRRAVIAAGAMLAAPALLALTILQALAGRRAPDMVTPLVERLYAQERLLVAVAPRRERGGLEGAVAAPSNFNSV